MGRINYASLVNDKLSPKNSCSTSLKVENFSTAQPNKLPFVLCADDYGQSEAIDDAIIDLALQGRISAISCLASSKRWPQAAKKLAAVSSKVDIGIHFNLTQAPLLQQSFTALSLAACLWRSHLHLLSTEKLRQEFRLQWQAFAEHAPRAADFIDGHQHVHVLPQVQLVFLQELSQLDPQQKVYVRLPYSKVWCNLVRGRIKQAIIAAAGGYRLQRRLKISRRLYNPTFSGAYDFAADDYAPVFREAITELKSQQQPYGIIMCHPGQGGDHDDAIAASRVKELQYFLSDQFSVDCDQAGVLLSRMSV